MEVSRGRWCDSVRVAQADEIKKKGKELVANGAALKLSQRQGSELDSLLNNSKEGNEIQAMQFQKDLQTEKRKTKRWRRIGIIQGVGLIGILILIL